MNKKNLRKRILQGLGVVVVSSVVGSGAVMITDAVTNKTHTEHYPDGYKIEQPHSYFFNREHLTFTHNYFTRKETAYLCNSNTKLSETTGDSLVDVVTGMEVWYRGDIGTKQIFLEADKDFKRVKYLLLPQKSEKG